MNNKITLSFEKLEQDKNITITGPLKIHYIIKEGYVVDLINGGKIVSWELNQELKSKLLEIKEKIEYIKNNFKDYLDEVKEKLIEKLDGFENTSQEYQKITELIGNIKLLKEFQIGMYEQCNDEVLNKIKNGELEIEKTLTDCLNTVEYNILPIYEKCLMFIDFLEEDQRVIIKSFNVYHNVASVLKHIKDKLKNPLVTLEQLSNSPNFNGIPTEENGHVLAYIANIHDEKDPSQSNGMYFSYDYTNKRWIPILIGTHTHNNKEMLDTIGVAYDSLTLDDQLETKFLSIRKIANHTKSSVINGEIQRLELVEPRFGTSFVNEWAILEGGSGEGAEVSIKSHKESKTTYKYELFILNSDQEQNTGVGYNYLVGDILTVNVKNENQIIRLTVEVLDVDINGKLKKIGNIYPAVGTQKLENTDMIAHGGSGSDAKLFLQCEKISSEIFFYDFDLISKGHGYNTNDILNYNVNTLTGTLNFKFRVLEKNTEFEYKFVPEWKNVTLLPDKPIDGEEYFAKLDKQGQVVWSKEFGSRQCFKKYVKNIERDNNQVIFNNIQFNEDADSVLIFKNNLLMPDTVYNYNSNENIMLLELDVLNNDIVTLITIKDTSAEILSKLSDNFVSKQEAIRILSNGKINLEDYIQKSEAYNAFARSGHIHTNYASKDHTHHGIYAPYFHTHDDLYVNREEFNKQLANLLNTKPELIDLINDIASNLDKIQKAFVGRNEFEITTKTINQKIQNINELLKKTVTLNNNNEIVDNNGQVVLIGSNNILTKYISENTGEQITLEEYIETLFGTMNDVINKYTNRVQNDIIVTNPIGGYKTDEKIYKNTKIEKILTKMLSEKVERPQVIVKKINFNDFDLLKNKNMFLERNSILTFEDVKVLFESHDGSLCKNIKCDLIKKIKQITLNKFAPNGFIEEIVEERETVFINEDNTNELIIPNLIVNTTNLVNLEIVFYANYYYSSQPSNLRNTLLEKFNFGVINPVYINNKSVLPNKTSLEVLNEMKINVVNSNEINLLIPKEYDIKDIILENESSILKLFNITDGKDLLNPKPLYNEYQCSFGVNFEVINLILKFKTFENKDDVLEDNFKLSTKPFVRLTNKPLESTTIFENFTEMDKYVKFSKVAYDGQCVSLTEPEKETEMFIIAKDETINSNENPNKFILNKVITNKNFNKHLNLTKVLKTMTFNKNELIEVENITIQKVDIRVINIPQTEYLGNVSLKLYKNKDEINETVETIIPSEDIIIRKGIINENTIYKNVEEKSYIILETNGVMDVEIIVTYYTYSIV